MLFYPNIY